MPPRRRPLRLLVEGNHVTLGQLNTLIQEIQKGPYLKCLGPTENRLQTSGRWIICDVGFELHGDGAPSSKSDPRVSAVLEQVASPHPCCDVSVLNAIPCGPQRSS